MFEQTVKGFCEAVKGCELYALVPWGHVSDYFPIDTEVVIHALHAFDDRVRVDYRIDDNLGIVIEYRHNIPIPQSVREAVTISKDPATDWDTHCVAMEYLLQRYRRAIPHDRNPTMGNLWAYIEGYFSIN